MLIHCPLRNKDEVAPLIAAGADVFYAGARSKIIFGNETGIANRHPWDYANFNSLMNLKSAVAEIHRSNKKINIVINEHFYSSGQINKILKFAENLKDVDGFIVADLNVILKLKKFLPNITLIASTGTHILNQGTVDFYFDLGIREMILPRHLKIKEIKGLIKNYKEKINFKCFIKNDDCAYIDGLCRYSHGLCEKEHKSACELLHKFKIYGNNSRKVKIISERYKNYHKIIFNECGICSIFEFNKIGVKDIKIVGRTLPLEHRLKDVAFTKEAIQHLDNCNNKKDFVKFNKKNYFIIYNKNCLDKCFY